jgi:hypothetical protein
MSEETKIAGRLCCKNRKLVLEFRQESPETIGETDTTFDYGNYIEWLEIQLIKERSEGATTPKQPDNSEALSLIDNFRREMVKRVEEEEIGDMRFHEINVRLCKIRALIGGECEV